MKYAYPNTGELMIKSCTAIEHLARSVAPDDLPSLCKSIAAGLPGTPKAKPEAADNTAMLLKAMATLIAERTAIANHHTLASRNSTVGVDTTQLHHGLEAQKELRKCLAVMRDQRMPASVIVKFQQATEAALANPAIDNGMLTKSLIQLRNS